MMIKNHSLESDVELLGIKTPDEVRNLMKISSIFISTSDFREGWGAVINEAMNSCCAIVASHALGAVPFLIRNGFNGFIYPNRDTVCLCKKVACLLNDPSKTKELANNAYWTIANEWNAEQAGERLLKLIDQLRKDPINECKLFRNGPCSPAPRIGNNWIFKKGCD